MSNTPKLIIGLGNPGPRYETTRHNAGFLAVDQLIDAWNAQGPQQKFEAEIYEAQVSGQKVYIVKPQTFMNLSGKSVGALFQFYKCTPEDLIVIHDEVDLPFTTLRIKTGGGPGGHNGVKSVDASVGAKNVDYWRVRIGVGRSEEGLATDVYVLQPFADAEWDSLKGVFDRVEQATRLLIEGKSTEAMNQFHRKEI